MSLTLCLSGRLCLSRCLSVWPSVSVFYCLSIWPSVSLLLSVYLAICLCLCLSYCVCLSGHLSLSVYLSGRLFLVVWFCVCLWLAVHLAFAFRRPRLLWCLCALFVCLASRSCCLALFPFFMLWVFIVCLFVYSVFLSSRP